MDYGKYIWSFEGYNGFRENCLNKGSRSLSFMLVQILKVAGFFLLDKLSWQSSDVSVFEN